MKHGLIDHATLQHMLYDALDQSDDIVLVLERTGEAADDLVLVSANESFCRASGYAHADVIGQSLRSLLAAAAETSLCIELERTANERRSCQSELLLKRKSGEPFWFGLHMMPVRDAGPTLRVARSRHHRTAACANSRRPSRGCSPRCSSASRRRWRLSPPTPARYR